MYAQCPQCLTIFAIDAATLVLAHGCVRCGECGATFDTIATLTDELPAEPFETLTLNDPAPEPPLLIERVYHEAPPQQGLFTSALADEPEFAVTAVATDTDADDALAPVAATATASANPFHRRPRGRGRHRRWLQAGCAVLAVVLALQLAWAERASPSLRGVCLKLGCPLPLIHDPGQLELLSRDIRRHPSVADALLISATLRNDAAFRQPYPVVAITLSDLDGNRVAMRRFRPAEYLHNPALREAGLAPGATAALVFEVRDPGRNAVAFEFKFE